MVSVASARQYCFLVLVAPAAQGVHGERVVDVDDHGDGGIDRGDFFDGQNRAEECAADAAVLLGDFDAHEAEGEELRQRFWERSSGRHPFRGPEARSSCARTCGPFPAGSVLRR